MFKRLILGFMIALFLSVQSGYSIVISHPIHHKKIDINTENNIEEVISYRTTDKNILKVKTKNQVKIERNDNVLKILGVILVLLAVAFIVLVLGMIIYVFMV